jgi:hypothetical protein
MVEYANLVSNQLSATIPRRSSVQSSTMQVSLMHHCKASRLSGCSWWVVYISLMTLKPQNNIFVANTSHLRKTLDTSYYIIAFDQNFQCVKKPVLRAPPSTLRLTDLEQEKPVTASAQPVGCCPAQGLTVEEVESAWISSKVLARTRDAHAGRNF